MAHDQIAALKSALERAARTLGEALGPNTQAVDEAAPSPAFAPGGTRAASARMQNAQRFVAHVVEGAEKIVKNIVGHADIRLSFTIHEGLNEALAQQRAAGGKGRIVHEECSCGSDS